MNSAVDMKPAYAGMDAGNGKAGLRGISDSLRDRLGSGVVVRTAMPP